MLIFILGLLIFFGVHCVRIVAPEWSIAQIAMKGDAAWKGVYSLLSMIGLIAIIYGYSLWRPLAEDLYFAPDWGRSAAFVLMLIAFILMMASNLKAGFIKEKVKHPLLLSSIVWAIAHLLSNGDSATVVLAGSFVVWGIVDFISLSKRNQKDPVSTGMLPDIISVVSGTLIWALFVYVAHEWLFGVPVS